MKTDAQLVLETIAIKDYKSELKHFNCMKLRARPQSIMKTDAQLVLEIVAIKDYKSERNHFN